LFLIKKRYFKDIKSLNLEILTSQFQNNYSLYGASLDFNSINNTTQTITNNITISDSKFTNNKAEYFGGAIYSNFENIDLSHITNTTFIGNKAYAGGAIYIHNENFTLIDEKMIKKYILNNTSESHGHNIATKPYQIEFQSEILTDSNINLKIGDNLQLEFELKDQFNQTVIDQSKYYDNIIIKAVIHNEEENEYLLNEVLLTSNTCYFFKGIY